MTPRESIVLAEQLARRLAVGQFRRDGTTPAITHQEKVVANLIAMRADWVEVSAGWLHDTPEDSPDPIAMFQLLRDAGVPPSVLEVLDLTTHWRGMTYSHYITRMIKHPIRKVARRAMRVKKADIQANLSETPTAHQVAKYYGALEQLENAY